MKKATFYVDGIQDGQYNQYPEQSEKDFMDDVYLAKYDLTILEQTDNVTFTITII